MGLVNEKIKLLQAMDAYIRTTTAGAEKGDIALNWWEMGGIPEYATTDDLDYIARHQEEWVSVCQYFGYLIQHFNL